MPRQAPNPFTALESTTTTPQVSPAMTNLMNQLSTQIGNIPKFDFNQYLQQAFQGPYFKSVSQGLLGALQPQEQQAQRGLSDQFRGAGMLNSTAFGQGMSNLMGQQGQYRNQMMSQLAQSLLGSSLQAGQLGLQSSMAPISAGTGLLNAMPRGSTTTSNIDMNAMLQLLQTLRGSMGGGMMDPWADTHGGQSMTGGGGGGWQQLLEALRGGSGSTRGMDGTSGGPRYGDPSLTTDQRHYGTGVNNPSPGAIGSTSFTPGSGAIPGMYADASGMISNYNEPYQDPFSEGDYSGLLDMGF